MVMDKKTSEDVRNSSPKNPESSQNSLMKNEDSLSIGSRQTSQTNQNYSTDGICRTVPYTSDNSQMMLNCHKNQAIHLMFTDNNFTMYNNAHDGNDSLVITGPALPQNCDPAMLNLVSSPLNYIVQEKKDLPSSQASVLSNIVIPAEQYSLVNAPIATSFSRIPAIITDPNESSKSVASYVQMPLIFHDISTSSAVQHGPLPSCVSTEVVKTPSASIEVVNTPAASPEVVNMPPASPNVLNSSFALSDVVITTGITSEDTSWHESDETLSSSSSIISLTHSDLPAPPSDLTSQNKKIGRRRRRDPLFRYNGKSRNVPTAFVNGSSACHTSGNASPCVVTSAQSESSISLSSETVITPTLYQASIRKSNFLPPFTIAPTENISALQRSIDVITRNHTSSIVESSLGSSVWKSNFLPPCIVKPVIESFSTVHTSAHRTTRKQNYSTAEIMGAIQATTNSLTHQTPLETLNLVKYTCTDAAVNTTESGGSGVVTSQLSVAPSKRMSATVTLFSLLSGAAADEVPSTLQATEYVQSAKTVSTCESSATNELRTETSTIQTHSKYASSVNAVLRVVSSDTGEAPKESFQTTADSDLNFVTTLDRDRVNKSNTQTTMVTHGGITAHMGLTSSLASSPTIPVRRVTHGIGEISRGCRLATHSKSTVGASSSSDSTDDYIDGDSGWQKYPVGRTFKSSGVSDVGCIYPEILQSFKQCVQQLSSGTVQLRLQLTCCPSCRCLNILVVDHSTFYCRKCNQIFALHQKGCTGKLHYEYLTSEQYKCSECVKTFCSRYYLNIHKAKHNGTVAKHTGKKGSNFCDICGIKLSEKNNLLAHMQTHHSKTEKYKCSKCDKKFCSRHFLNIHKAKHNGTVAKHTGN